MLNEKVKEENLMKEKIAKRLKSIRIFLILFIFTIPSFIFGQAFAYWAGIISAPAQVNDAMQTTSGSGKEIPVNFTFTSSYTTTFKLVPIGCYVYAYDQTVAKEEVYNDYNMSWSTTDATALETNVNMAFVSAGLYDKRWGDHHSAYTNYIQVKFELGTYATPGDHTSFVAEQSTTFNAQTPGNVNYMLQQNQTKIFRLAVSMIDYPRTNQTAYLNYKGAVVNSYLKVNLRYTVSNPNLYKSTAFWASFNTTNVTNKNLGPYQYEATSYAYDPEFEEYTDGGGYYNEGDIIVVTNPNSPYYGYYYYVLETGWIDLGNDGSAQPHKRKWAKCTKNYTMSNQYDRGDFVVWEGNIYYWSHPDDHHNFNPHCETIAPPTTTHWTLAFSNDTENVWFRHHTYGYGDVVKWWNGNPGGTTPINLYYVSIADVNTINDITSEGNNLSPDPSDYPARWVTVSQFQSRSAAFSNTRAYNEGESILYNGKYYIATIATVAGRNPDNSPNHWKLVNLP